MSGCKLQAGLKQEQGCELNSLSKVTYVNRLYVNKLAARS
jgi:hypothetical protein